ncbi:MAG: YqeG family HAD IIIA-type phosphatase [Prochlorococcaceae cyanobacterium]|jgi:HAD superfamily phosphatase (TIGR01668 family)
MPSRSAQGIRALPRLLTPDLVVPGTLVDLSLERLQDRPIRALILDVDRTLLPRHRSDLPSSADAWLRRARERMPLHLLSNNPSRRRIGSVAEQLGLPFTTSAGKPRRTALRKVLTTLGLPHQEVALIGDRLFTDVLAGNRLGLYTVLVRPIDPEGRPCRQDHLQRLEINLARWMGTPLA